MIPFVTKKFWDHNEPNSLSNSFSVAKVLLEFLSVLLQMKENCQWMMRLENICPNSTQEITRSLPFATCWWWAADWIGMRATALYFPTTEAYYGTNLHKQMTRLKVISEPGKTFDYMSCNTEILGMVLEKATGMKVSEYASENCGIKSMPCILLIGRWTK